MANEPIFRLKNQTRIISLKHEKSLPKLCGPLLRCISSEDEVADDLSCAACGHCAKVSLKRQYLLREVFENDLKTRNSFNLVMFA